MLQPYVPYLWSSLCIALGRVLEPEIPGFVPNCKTFNSCALVDWSLRFWCLLWFPLWWLLQIMILLSLPSVIQSVALMALLVCLRHCHGCSCSVLIPHHSFSPGKTMPFVHLNSLPSLAFLQPLLPNVVSSYCYWSCCFPRVHLMFFQRFDPLFVLVHAVAVGTATFLLFGTVLSLVVVVKL